MEEENQLRLYSIVPLMQMAEKSSLDDSPSAVGAYNVNFYAQAEGILKGLSGTDAPGIIQASKGACKFQGGPDVIQYIVLEAMKNLGHEHPVAVHLDHGDETSAIECVDKGFSSVMIDASHLPDEENIAATNAIVEYAHPRGVSVEGEYGLLAGVEEDTEHAKSVYADPRFVPEFLERSGADALAIAYGTSHGPNKGRTDSLDTTIVRDSYQGLLKASMTLDKFLVGHGSSTVPAELVAGINALGGTLEGTSGVPGYKIKEAIEYGIRKVNIDTDLRLKITLAMRQFLADNPGVEKSSEALGMIKGVFDGTIPALDKHKKPIEPGMLVDPRSYLDPVKKNMPELLREDYHKCEDDAFIEAMELVSQGVAEHVADLNRMFGSAGLAR
ncbi:fructose-bisphosphate aldolase [Candidatus Woesearchaeota archaeon]|nr:fructose-bisphosphate aldolase [Candidatus Woesearchaeota archaeon]